MLAFTKLHLRNCVSIIIRAAIAADQPTITALVRTARLMRWRLAWHNFLVAERIEEGTARIVGVGQLRPHSDGTLELASLAVIPEEQGHGIGGELVHTLLRKASVSENQHALYLMCEGGKVPYYQRFGFYELTVLATMPRTMRRFYQVATPLRKFLSALGIEIRRLAIMTHPL
jgi:N-acetylglutamate synthase-like GNAT family acetyltransferase